MTISVPFEDTPIHVARVASPTPSAEERAALRESLTRPVPEVPPRYFYDDLGSELFEQITQLPVYYQTRTEIAILEQFAEDIMAKTQPIRVVELGSGAGRKIRLLLDAWRPAPLGATCVMLDINELFLRTSLERLSADYGPLRFQGVVGDFVQDLERLGPMGRRLIVFFAGTMGNLAPGERHSFLRTLAAGMDTTDSFLVGVDLVKDHAQLKAAYDDPEGVTAAFNKNMLAVVNRRFDGNFDPDSFEHRAFYDADNAWIEMRLVSTRRQTADLRAINLSLALESGDELRTEISCKFTRESLMRDAARAGLSVQAWYVDPDSLFALALLQKGVS